MFFSQLEIAEKTYDVEAVHEMRVAVKKLRSLLKMFKILFPDSKNKNISFQYLRNIFKSAANIRDSHVMTALINQYITNSSGCNDLLLYFKNIENEGINSFNKVVAETKQQAIKTSFEYSEELKKNKVNTETNNKIDLYVKKKIIDLSELLKTATNNKSVHKFRIKLKELNFILGVQDDNKKQKIITVMKSLASELGLWHDKIILINHMEKFYMNLKNNIDLREYKKLQNLLFSESKNESKNIINRLEKNLLYLSQNY